MGPHSNLLDGNHLPMTSCDQGCFKFDVSGNDLGDDSYAAGTADFCYPLWGMPNNKPFDL